MTQGTPVVPLFPVTATSLLQLRHAQAELEQVDSLLWQWIDTYDHLLHAAKDGGRPNPMAEYAQGLHTAAGELAAMRGALSHTADRLGEEKTNPKWVRTFYYVLAIGANALFLDTCDELEDAHEYASRGTAMACRIERWRSTSDHTGEGWQTRDPDFEILYYPQEKPPCPKPKQSPPTPPAPQDDNSR
jgi:hypothetical protein